MCMYMRTCVVSSRYLTNGSKIILAINYSYPDYRKAQNTPKSKG